MPRKSRTAEPVDPSTLYSTEPLSDGERQILHDAELMIRRWKLRLKIIPKNEVPLWTWDYFIEALGATKASIDMGIVPSIQSPLNAQEEARWSQIVANYQKAHSGSPVAYSAILVELDKLLVKGMSTKEILLRLLGDAAKPIAHYAESWEVENSGLFAVQAT